MAATYNSSSQVNPGNNYAPASATDSCLIYIAFGYRNGPTSGSAQTFGATSMTEILNQDIDNDLLGGGDPTCNSAQLVNPGTSSQTLDLTWSATPASEQGIAMTFAGVNQTTPIYATNGSNAAEYDNDSTPTVSYDAPADSVIVYWCLHAGPNGGTTFTDPASFTKRHDITIITTPTSRHFGVWTRETASLLTSQTVGATFGAGDDGIHGVFVLQEEPVVGGGTTLSGSLGLTGVGI